MLSQPQRLRSDSKSSMLTKMNLERVGCLVHQLLELVVLKAKDSSDDRMWTQSRQSTQSSLGLVARVLTMQVETEHMEILRLQVDAGDELTAHSF